MKTVGSMVKAVAKHLGKESVEFACGALEMMLDGSALAQPMEALPVDDLPTGKGWLFELKYDGFRCLLFRESAEVICNPAAAPNRGVQTGGAEVS